MRPPSNSAAQEDGFAASSSNSAQTNGNSSQGEDKGKKKGKAPKFERLRLTGGSHDRAFLLTCMHVLYQLRIQMLFA